METYIFVHNQSIILDFIESKKFNDLGLVKYVFLGDSSIDKIENLENVIVCRNLKFNIETYPYLTSFTGWFALWKNNIIKTDVVNLFEYDVNISKNLKGVIETNIQSGCQILGYLPLSVRDINYVREPKWISQIQKSLKKVYGINIYDFVNSLEGSTEVSVTSNHTFKIETFNDFMNWVFPMLDDIKLSHYSGHEIERSISFYYLTNKINYCITKGNIDHLQLNSHGTQNMDSNRFEKNYKKLI